MSISLKRSGERYGIFSDREDEEDENDVERSIMEKDFSTLLLEYKLSHINHVKAFSRYLNEIHCFYTDRQVDFDMLETFTQEQIQRIAPLEYERWLREHQSMELYGTLFPSIS